ncbi:DUF5074 domain-containing protein [Maribellus sp. CM-23]|uniref:DUF5074 domain-containing protein n=1 Tax=Maribellus sp. CM-23 TaxID=2781026 RepID=UPI001F217CF7|nr:DUF5074 domain-containing protein [Maribellus sp. CM-23]MCE4565537.1 DUF5074 domain-containing protein [Maribellus sp. CM-23]
MKKNLKLLAALFIGITLLSCSDDDPILPNPPSANIKSLGGGEEIAQNDTLYLIAEINSSEEATHSWLIDNQVVEAGDTLAFVSGEVGNHEIVLKASNAGGEYSTTFSVSVFGKYRDGVWVLNEGNMTSENGTLIFISSKGVATDSVYQKVNGSELGNSTQDLFIADGKMYIMAQNGDRAGGDGMLVVANAETLEKEVAYSNAELEALSWPTHVAVVGNSAYIRDNAGVYLLNLESKELTFVDGTSGAMKNRMAVVNGKVFVPAGKKVFVLQDGQLKGEIELPGTLSGIVRSADDKLLVSCNGTPSYVLKIDPADNSTIQQNEVADVRISAGWGASPAIGAKGDTVYFSSSTKIYRHILETGETKEMTDVKNHIENAGIVYNNLGVHPISGEVYFNTIKGYGLDFLINDITVFNFSSETPVLVKDFKDYTNFPAGIFFTDNFR